MHRVAKIRRLLASQRVPLPLEFLTMHHLHELLLMPCSHELAATSATTAIEQKATVGWSILQMQKVLLSTGRFAS
jgi:hypothetical protein